MAASQVRKAKETYAPAQGHLVAVAVGPGAPTVEARPRMHKLARRVKAVRARRLRLVQMSTVHHALKLRERCDTVSTLT